jgi:hypothetical protein
MVSDRLAVVRSSKSATAIADYAWEAENEDELSFPEGAVITDIVKLLVVSYHRPTDSHQPSRYIFLRIGGVGLMKAGRGFFRQSSFTTSLRLVRIVHPCLVTCPCLTSWCQKRESFVA